MTEKAFSVFPSVPLAPAVTLIGGGKVDVNFGYEDLDENGDQNGKFDFDLKGHRQAVLDSYDPIQKAEEECIRALRTLGMSIGKVIS